MVPVALSVTVAGTFAAAPAARRLKLAVVIVAAFSGLLNVAVTVVVRGTPVAPFGGATVVTVSSVVVKLHVEAVPSAVPATSVTVAATVAGWAVPDGSGGGGARVAMVPVALTIRVAGTSAAAPAARRVKVAVVIVAAFMGLLNVAETVVLSGTLIAPFGGAWAITLGAALVVKLHVEAVPIGVPTVSVTVAASEAV